MGEKLIKLCGLYENVSKTSGKKYFTGNLSFTSKLLVFENQDAKEGEPGWTVFIAEREPKPQPQPTPQPVGDFGGISGGDYPRKARKTA